MLVWMFNRHAFREQIDQPRGERFVVHQQSKCTSREFNATIRLGRKLPWSRHQASRGSQQTQHADASDVGDSQARNTLERDRVDVDRLTSAWAQQKGRSLPPRHHLDLSQSAGQGDGETKVIRNRQVESLQFHVQNESGIKLYPN